MSHRNSWRDSCASTRRDGCGGWLWRLVGFFLHLRIQCVEGFQYRGPILRVCNPLRNSRGCALILPSASIALSCPVLRCDIRSQETEVLAIRDPQVMSGTSLLEIIRKAKIPIDGFLRRRIVQARLAPLFREAARGAHKPSWREKEKAFFSRRRDIRCAAAGWANNRVTPEKFNEQSSVVGKPKFFERVHLFTQRFSSAMPL